MGRKIAAQDSKSSNIPSQGHMSRAAPSAEAEIRLRIGTQPHQGEKKVALRLMKTQ